MPENDMLPPYSHRESPNHSSRNGSVHTAHRLRAHRGTAPCMLRNGSAHTARRLRVPPRSGSVTTKKPLGRKGHTMLGLCSE